jgi:hypothetical protein
MKAPVKARRNCAPFRKVFFSVIASTLAIGTPAVSQAQGPVLTKLTSWAKSHGKPPVTAEDKALEQLAANVDWLEHHINQWGSVTSKAPDVWGEARLTQYRDEVEEILGPQRSNFNPGLISGAQQVSDSAILSFALALQNKGAGVAAPSISVNSTVVGSANAFSADATKFLGGTLGLEQTQMIDQMQRYIQHVNAWTS